GQFGDAADEVGLVGDQVGGALGDLFEQLLGAGGEVAGARYRNAPAGLPFGTFARSARLAPSARRSLVEAGLRYRNAPAGLPFGTFARDRQPREAGLRYRGAVAHVDRLARAAGALVGADGGA